MRSFHLYASLVALPTLILACGDDDVDPTGASGSGASSSSGAGGSVTKPLEALSGAITSDMTLTAANDYLLEGVVRVESGATLTIEPGTKIMGEGNSKGTLVIKQGARIEAAGTADEPIVFTSQLPAGSRAAGDWGGLVILGRAPINEPGGTASAEGFTTDETYGGTDPADDSGTLRYVRIEFSGVEISTDNEINGLTLAGVGSGTQIDHVMVRHTLDDCFEFFGGTVNASHLVCYRNGDDGFDFDQGYVGKLQFLFLQQDPTIADDANGFESDNDSTDPNVTPVTDPTIYNVTLCGQNTDNAKQQYGFLFRRGFHATIANAIVTGFEAGVDIRDAPATDVTLTSSIFFGNSPENIAYLEDGSNPDTEADDDAGLDERAWFASGTGNAETDPMLGDCFASSPDPLPASEIPGATPPSDGFFDTSATFVGAFAPGDNWASGAWIDWSAN